MIRAYWGTLLSVDDSVGRLYELLKHARASWIGYIIVFMSDNGILNGEHGMVDKRTAHEPSIRIVQVVRFPGLVKPNQPKVIERKCSRSTSLLVFLNSVEPQRYQTFMARVGRSWCARAMTVGVDRFSITTTTRKQFPLHT